MLRPEDTFYCRKYDPDRWFPVGYGPASVADTDFAVSVCNMCPAKVACGNWALDQGIEFGIWGGMTELDRRAIRRRGALRGAGRALHPTDRDALVH